MEIKIKNKKGKKSAGRIRSSDFRDGCFIDITYHTNPEVIKDIQNVLLKYYDLELIHGRGGRKRSSLIVPEVKNYKSKSLSLSYSKSLKKIKKSKHL